MSKPGVRYLCSLVAYAVFGGCSPAALKPERHELRPIANAFSVVAPALPQAMGVLGMQVAQQSAGPNVITVSATTPEGVRVQITLRPSSLGSSNLDVQGEAEQLALAQLANRLAEALAKQVAQNNPDSHEQELMQLGYVASEPEPEPEPAERGK